MRALRVGIYLVIAALLMILTLAFEASAQHKPKAEVVPLIGHSIWVGSVAFSPDGRQVLSGSDDKTLKLWDTGSGALLRTFQGHSDRVWSVAFSPDGRQVLSGSWDNTLKLWDVTSGALLRTFSAHSAEVNSVAFSPDGRQLLSGSVDNTLKLWDAVSGALLRTFGGHSNYVTSVAFSPDGRQLLSGSQDNTLKLWDATSGTLLRTLEGHSNWVKSVAFSPDGRQLLSGSWDHTLKLWDAASGALVRIFEGHALMVLSVAFSPDGLQLLSGSEDNTLKLWDAASGALLRTFEGHSRGVQSVAFSPDGRQALSGSHDAIPKLWDAASGALLRTFGGGGWNAVVDSVEFSSDGRQVVSHSYGNTLKLWDAASGALLRTERRRFGGRLRWEALSPDGRQVLSTDMGNTLKLSDAASDALLRTFEGHSGQIQSVAFSPDGRQLLSGSQDNTLKLWDAASGALLHTFTGHSDLVESVAFSPDGRQVLSASWDYTLKLWDAASGDLLRTFTGHSGRVKSVAFSPDGRQVVSGGGDGTIRVWNVVTGAALVTFLAPPQGGWLAITAEGFFAGSAEASDKMVSVVRGLDVTTIGQVHQSLFNPDLVRAALAGDPEGEFGDAAKIINLEKVLDSGPAPIVAITSHVEESQSKLDVVGVQARITDRGNGIGRVEWRVNGVTAAVSAKPAGAGPDYTTTQQLALDPGDNIIEVLAYNASNLLASLPARTTIKFTGPADAAKPKLHVLAIGINAYNDNGWKPVGQDYNYYFEPLKLAVKDAQAFGEGIKRAAGSLYADVRVTTVTDAEATRTNLPKVIDKIAAEVHPRDTFILFAAAHGKSEAGRFYLIPQDYDGGPDPQALAKRAIDQSMLQDWLANLIKARKAVILLDTCESGALVSGHSRSRIDQPASEAALGRLHEATGRPVLTAAAEGNPAFEGFEGHGVFTWALLDALKNGDRNGNGTIELSELVAHVQDQVPKIAAKLNGIGRAAIAVRGSTDGSQSARLGSKGEDFALAGRLQ